MLPPPFPTAPPSSFYSRGRRSTICFARARFLLLRTGCGETATRPDQDPSRPSRGSDPTSRPNSSFAAGAAFVSPRKQTARGAMYSISARKCRRAQYRVQGRGGERSVIGRTLAAWTKNRPASKNRRFPSASERREIQKLYGDWSSSPNSPTRRLSVVEVPAGIHTIFGGWRDSNKEHSHFGGAGISSAASGRQTFVGQSDMHSAHDAISLWICLQLMREPLLAANGPHSRSATRVIHPPRVS
jgi:hypothetical protein